MSRRAAPVLRAFDPAKYLGSEERGVAAPYTTQQLTVMVAGSSAIWLAILKRGRKTIAREAAENAEQNRRRFHPGIAVRPRSRRKH